MRRILRKLAADEKHQLGDISTLLNPEIVDSIIKRMDAGGLALMELGIIT